MSEQDKEILNEELEKETMETPEAVSYTHLTLPTT